MKPISKDKREIIIAAKERGEKVGTIALWAGVATSSVYKILALHKESGNIEPKPFLGRPSTLTPEQLSKIKEAVEKENDITLDELIEKLKLPIKKSRLSVVLISMDFSFKKRHFIQKHKSERMSSKPVPTGKKTKTS
jgi:transposase